MHLAVKAFCHLYGSFNTDTVNQLADVYSDQVVFEDPAHKIEGLTDLQNYFAGLLTNLSDCHFVIKEVVEHESQGFVTWHMTFSHRQLNKGKPITVPGTTHLRFADKVYYHRDYFDMGALVYSHLPIIGPIINYIKRRMAA